MSKIEGVKKCADAELNPNFNGAHPVSWSEATQDFVFLAQSPLMAKLSGAASGAGEIFKDVPTRFQFSLNADQPSLEAVVKTQPQSFCFKEKASQRFYLPRKLEPIKSYSSDRNPEKIASAFSAQDLAVKNSSAVFKTLDLSDPKIQLETSQLWHRTNLLLSPEEAQVFRHYLNALGVDADKMQKWPGAEDSRGWAEYAVHHDVLFNDSENSSLVKLKKALLEKFKSPNKDEASRAFFLSEELVIQWADQIRRSGNEIEGAAPTLTLEEIPDELLGSTPEAVARARQEMDQLKKQLIRHGIAGAEEAPLSDYINGYEVGESVGVSVKPLSPNLDEIVLMHWLEADAVHYPGELVTWINIGGPLFATSSRALKKFIPLEDSCARTSLDHRRENPRPLTAQDTFEVLLRHDAKLSVWIRFFKELSDKHRKNSNISGATRAESLSRSLEKLQTKIRMESTRWGAGGEFFRGGAWNSGGTVSEIAWMVVKGAVTLVLGKGLYGLGNRLNIPFLSPVTRGIRDMVQSVRRGPPPGGGRGSGRGTGPRTRAPRGTGQRGPKPRPRSPVQLRIGLDQKNISKSPPFEGLPQISWDTEKLPIPKPINPLGEYALKPKFKTVYEFVEKPISIPNNFSGSWIYAAQPLAHGIRVYGPRLAQSLPHPLVKLGVGAAVGAVVLFSASDAQADEPKLEGAQLISKKVSDGFEIVRRTGENESLTPMSQEPMIIAAAASMQSAYDVVIAKPLGWLAESFLGK